ncbi:hypothetical protein HYY75_13510, partial [bacterium]|nr:hypothetical protein [bacterium]
MLKKLSSIGFIALLNLILLFSFGCGKSPSLPPEVQVVADDKGPRTLHIGLPLDPRQLNPILPLDENSRFVCGMIHAAPLRRTPG